VYIGLRPDRVYLIDSVSFVSKSQMSSLRVCLRTDGEFEQVKAWVDKHGIGGFAVREGQDSENEHEHWLLFWGNKTLKAVRSLFTREVPDLKGNGKYSMSEVEDLDKYVRYMCKGKADYIKPVVVWRNTMTYTDDVIDENHKAYWEENKKLKRKRVSGSTVDAVIDICKERQIDWNDRREIARVYIRMLGERGKPINLFALRANLNAVQFALCGNDDCLEALVDRVEQYS